MYATKQTSFLHDQNIKTNIHCFYIYRANKMGTPNIIVYIDCVCPSWPPRSDRQSHHLSSQKEKKKKQKQKRFPYRAKWERPKPQTPPTLIHKDLGLHCFLMSPFFLLRNFTSLGLVILFTIQNTHGIRYIEYCVRILHRPILFVFFQCLCYFWIAYIF